MERRSFGYLTIMLIASTGSVIYFCVTEHLLSPFLFYLILLGLVLVIDQAIKRYYYESFLDCHQILLPVFFINVIAVVLIYYWLKAEVGIPYLAPGYWQDDWEFEYWSRRAYIVAHSLNYFDFTEYVPKGKHEGYFYLIGLVIYIGDLLGGYNTLMPRLLNSFLLSLICVLTYFIGREVSFAHKPCKLAALFVGFFPANIYYSAVILREDLSGVVVFCLLLIHLKSLRWRNVKLMIAYAAMALLCIVLWQIRTYTVVAFIGFYFISTLLMVLTKRGMGSKAIMAILITAIVLVVASDALYSVSEFTLESLEEFNRHKFVEGKYGLASQLAALPTPLNYIFKIVYGMITPLPLAKNLVNFLKSSGFFIWWFLLPFALWNAWELWKKRKMGLLIVIYWFIFLAGTTLSSFQSRHFLVWYPAAFLLSINGYYELRDKRTIFFAGQLGMLVLGLVVYVALKGSL